MVRAALFLNGVFESVLEEILQTQSVPPDQVFFLQPYKRQAMKFSKGVPPPSSEDPWRLFVSTTQDLPTVRYRGEIVRWDDKQTLSRERRAKIEQDIKKYQPANKGGLYDDGTRNLLHVRRLERADPPFSVERLVKVYGGGRLSPKRSTAGGWSYVRPEPVS